MRLTRSVFARFWLVCLLGLIFPLTAHAQFALNIRSPHPQLDPAIRSLAQACSSALNAAAAVSNSGTINADLSNVAVLMVTGNRAGLEFELQSARRYAAGVGPGELRTETEARICIRQAALNGTGAPVITPPGPTDGGISMEWFAGLWSGRADCSSVIDLRTDGTIVMSEGNSTWRIEDGNVLVLSTVSRLPLEQLDENSVRVVGNPQGFMYRCVVAAGSPSGYARAGAQSLSSVPEPSPEPSPEQSPEPPAPETSPQDTAVARVRLAGLYGTRCVIPTIRNVRRPPEENPAPTSWIGEWVLTNHCPAPQWVRIEVDALGHLRWAGLQTPGARMQPSPALEPSLAFQPIREADFHFGWLVPANGELVTASGDVVHASVIEDGMDVWIAACDGTGDARRQAIYLSAPFRDNPRAACWNHALPNGVGDGR